MPDPHKLSVRSAVPGDLDRVAEVWHASASSMDGVAANLPSREDLRRRIDGELEAGWQLKVAVSDGRVLGFLAIRPGNLVLDQIFVMPNAQCGGIGRALLDAAKAVLPNGFSLRMDAANARARRFYEQQGMRLIGSGSHPWTGIAVHFYGWKVASPSETLR